jgi:single-stranded-DNA-specific exonuclease
MRLSRTTDQLISSLPQLEELLMQRIPEADRSRFFSPPHPSELLTADHGLAADWLERARERIERAIAGQEKVLIFGDYDCDGITATAILWETLRERGLLAQPFLPHREKHGYGLSVKALEDVWQQFQPQLVITVDNGIVAHQAIAWLKEKQVDVIVTDHHESSGSLPPADVVLHSTKLCGATVSWMLAHALAPDFAKAQLDLAAIGTIADQVPLTGANRSFAWHGLQALRRTQRPSLVALAEVAGLKLAEASSTTVHFGLAPRINAMGRLYDALDALRALVSRHPERVRSLMQNLQTVNLERQELTKESLELVQRAIADHADESIVVVTGDFHEGIIGLIASKLVDLTHKPSIAIAVGGPLAKASCRSVAGCSIIDFLRGLDVPFLSLGGHTMAAGFSVSQEQLETAVQSIRSRAKTDIDRTVLEPSLDVIGPIASGLLNRATPELVARFAPFGAGNAEPLFLLPQTKITGLKVVGRDGKHAQLKLDYEGRNLAAICFGYREKSARENITGDLVVRLAPSAYRNRDLEIQVQHILIPDAARTESAAANF